MEKISKIASGGWIEENMDDSSDDVDYEGYKLLDLLCTPVTDTIVLGKKLGSGSYGSVYTYRNSMAVKVMWYEPDESPESNGENLIREIYVLLQLRGHQNILNLIECHRVWDMVYLVTELFDCDLSTVLFDSPGSPLTSERKHHIKTSLKAAVDYMHNKNILHLDIKPENVFMRADRTIVIGDFGFAHVFGRKRIFFKHGTHQYLRPSFLLSLLKKERVKEDDIWALACTLYELDTSMAFANETMEMIHGSYDPSWLIHEINTKLPTVSDPELKDMFDASY